MSFPPIEVKRSGREADHPPPSSAKAKNAWSSASTPLYVFMVWCLVRHGDNFTFINETMCGSSQMLHYTTFSSADLEIRPAQKWSSLPTVSSTAL
jgi:hypothetical protein